MDDHKIRQHQAADPVPAASTSAARRHRVAGGRPRHVKIRFTDAEYDAISARAVEAGVSIPRLLVDGALIRRRRPVVPTALIAELAGLRRLVANLANNVNQIARKLNSGGVPDSSSIRVTADALRRTLSRLDAALSSLGPLAPQPWTGSVPLRNAVPPPRSTPR